MKFVNILHIIANKEITTEFTASAIVIQNGNYKSFDFFIITFYTTKKNDF